jgi:hypothetical protein
MSCATIVDELEIYSPVVCQKDLLCRLNKTRFSVGWGVENLPRIFVRRRHDDETKHIDMLGQDRKIPPNKTSHVKNTQCTQCTRIPLSYISLHRRFHSTSELADYWDGPGITGQMALLASIYRLFQSQQRDNDCCSSIHPCYHVIPRSKE